MAVLLEQYARSNEIQMEYDPVRCNVLKILSIAALATLAFGNAAEARQCQRFGFSVNDYGKEGPARDAQALLDKYIKSEMDKLGVKNYTVGKKTVSCKLFLDLIVFDEYTCTAEADACWGLGPVTRQDLSPKKPAPAPAPTPAKTQ